MRSSFSFLLICGIYAVLVADASSADFEKDVKPVLQRRCVSCHGPDDVNGDVRLDILSTDLVGDSAAAETWHDVLNVLNLGEMPPKDEPQPSKAKVAKAIATLAQALNEADRDRNSVVLRRLNRNEYQNTIRDLFDDLH